MTRYFVWYPFSIIIKKFFLCFCTPANKKKVIHESKQKAPKFIEGKESYILKFKILFVAIPTEYLEEKYIYLKKMKIDPRCYEGYKNIYENLKKLYF